MFRRALQGTWMTYDATKARRIADNPILTIAGKVGMAAVPVLLTASLAIGSNVISSIASLDRRMDRMETLVREAILQRVIALESRVQRIEDRAYLPNERRVLPQ